MDFARINEVVFGPQFAEGVADNVSLESVVRRHVTELADHIGPRPTGSPGNIAAGEYIRHQLIRSGWQVHTPRFDCLTWVEGNASLNCDSGSIPARANPYSPGFSGSPPFVICDSIGALVRARDLSGRVLVLAGDLAREQYMPRNFPFLKLPRQQEVLSCLDRARPAAVIGIHSGPLFCDGDFSIPSVTVAPEHSRQLFDCQDHSLTLSITGSIRPSTASNVIASSPTGSDSRVVVCAHFDTWFDTPGAIDNAGGVSALLALGELLDPTGEIELVAFNGEDHYASPGQVQYSKGDLAGIRYVINIDGIGVKDRRCSVAEFGELPALTIAVRTLLEAEPGVVAVDPWPQGDHMIFVQRGIPAVALSSDGIDSWSAITHTPGDTGDLVDVSMVCAAVAFMQELLDRC